MNVIYTVNSDAGIQQTDIGRPYLVDNSTGTPVYRFLDEEDHSSSKRGATGRKQRLWPQGIIPYSFGQLDSSPNFTGA